MKRTLIITGGFLEPSFLIKILNKNHFDHIIAADHGLDAAREASVIPNLILGDFDSVSQETLETYKKKGAKIITYPTEKDYTDTELALMYALRTHPDQITIVGATGSRLDHVMGNFSLLVKGINEHVNVEIIDAHNRIRLMDHMLTIRKEEQWGKYVSLIPYTEKVTGITLEGFYYSMTDGILTLGESKGISNEITDAFGKITIQNGLLLVVESQD